MASATWDRNGWPTATVTLEGATYTCVVEGIDGLEAQRTTSADERVRGILSLDPPTVRSRVLDDLIDLATEAVDVAVASSLSDDGEPGDILMVRVKTAQAVRGALDLLGVAT
jgi:hypothetical protein